MKIMLLAFAATALIAAGADFALKNAGFSAQQRTVGEAVRLDE